MNLLKTEIKMTNKMDTSNLWMDYFTDTVTFARRVLISGADPSHTKDLKKMGGEFHCYLGNGRRGWVFGISMVPALEAYIKNGVATTHKKRVVNILDMPREGEKKDSGICNECKKTVKLDTAVKNCVRYYAGGLPKKVTGSLMDKEYRTKLSVAFANGSFVCTDCMKHNGKKTEIVDHNDH